MTIPVPNNYIKASVADLKIIPTPTTIMYTKVLSDFKYSLDFS